MKPIVKWQREQLAKELLLLQGHASDPSCPCASEGEKCVRKHLLSIEALAEETAPIHPEEAQGYLDLAAEAKELRKVEEAKLCGEEAEHPVDLAEWAREQRKRFEEVACEVKVEQLPPCRVFLQPLPQVSLCQNAISKIKITGTCTAGTKSGGVEMKVKQDPLLTAIGCQIGLCNPDPRVESTKPICTAPQIKKLERCVIKLKPCQEAGEIKSAYAVCTASIGCRGGRAKEVS